MSNTVVLVPSWARLSPDMEAETGSRYAAFVQLNGVPLYEHIVSQYKGAGLNARIVFLLAHDAPALKTHPAVSGPIEVVHLSGSRSIGETVLAGLREVMHGGPVIVHMADTLLDMELTPVGDAVYVQSRTDLYRWTTVSVDSNGRITVTSDREETEECVPRSVCVGLFSFSDGRRLGEVLGRAVARCEHCREPFFAALEEYSVSYAMDLRPAKNWMDCGHVDGYYESRLHHQNLRHFNTLSYDCVRGSVTKKSTNAEAFRKQVRWFKQIPDDVAPFLPRVFSSSDGSDPFITMELLSIPTLGDLFVSQRLDIGAWNDVVRSISAILSCFVNRAVANSLAPQLARAVYVDKTRSRLDEFIASCPTAREYSVGDGTARWTIDRVLQTLTAFVERLGLLRIDRLTPIHGDFCFSNLLYDCKVRLVKMIDPRGDFGVPGVFGDHRYDLAKLAHSYAGKYDLIVSDRFSVDLGKDGRLRVDTQADEYFTRVRSIFDAVLLPDPRLRQEVHAVQALLFLSMLPLHADKPFRQLAMLATGLQLYAQSWNAGAQ